MYAHSHSTLSFVNWIFSYQKSANSLLFFSEVSKWSVVTILGCEDVWANLNVCANAVGRKIEKYILQRIRVFIKQNSYPLNLYACRKSHRKIWLRSVLFYCVQSISKVAKKELRNDVFRTEMIGKRREQQLKRGDEREFQCYFWTFPAIVTLPRLIAFNECLLSCVHLRPPTFSGRISITTTRPTYIHQAYVIADCAQQWCTQSQTDTEKYGLSRMVNNDNDTDAI